MEKRSYLPYLFIFPALAVIFFLLVFPGCWSAYLSLHDVTVSTLHRAWHFVGGKNYIKMASSGRFINSLWVSLGYVGGSIFGQFFIGFGLAHLLTKGGRETGIFRPIFIIPWLVSVVVVAYTWGIIFDKYGILNYFLNCLGLGSISWLRSSGTALFSLVVANIWWGTAFSMLWMGTALRTIDPEIHDSAKVDGITGFHKLRRITLPMLKPFIAINFVLITMWTVNDPGLPMAMTGGAPAHGTETISLFMYHQGIVYGSISYGAAVTIVMLAIDLIAAFIYVRASR